MTTRTTTERAGRRVAALLDALYARVDALVAPLAARSAFLSSAYYWLSSRAFRREHHAALGARLLHNRQDSPDTISYRLRRNIHALEKGLTMRPPRKVFGLGVIADTVAGYEKILQASGWDVLETAWFHAVLKRYFDAAGDHPVIHAARDRFSRLPAPVLDRDASPIPGPSSPCCGTPAVRFEDLLALARQRKSVRWFLPKRVPRELIDNAVTVAGCSPTACNRQPFQFRIFDDPRDASRVAGVPWGTEGFSENVPAVAVVVGQLRAFGGEQDRHIVYIDASLAAMSFVLALQAQGLGSCCLNWPEVAEKEKVMAEVLYLEPDERPVLLVAFGYPDPQGTTPFSQKKPLERLRQYPAAPR